MEIVEKKEIPEWVKNSKKYKNKSWKKYNKDRVPLFDLKNGISTLDEFSLVLDCISFWRIYELPSEIWAFLFETKKMVMRKFLLERDDKIAKYLFEFQRKQAKSMTRYDLAMDEGEIGCFDYLYQNRDKYSLIPAGLYNHKKRYANVELIKYLHEHNLVRTNEDVMRVFLENDVVNFARIFGGNLDSLIYLYENE